NVEALADGSALVRWRTDAAAAGSVRYGTSPEPLTEVRYASGRAVRHLTLLASLTPGRRYYYRLASRDALGRRARSPVASFRMPAYGVADSRLAQWRTGSQRGTAVGARDDGELRLARGRRSGTFVSR